MKASVRNFFHTVMGLFYVLRLQTMLFWMLFV